MSKTSSPPAARVNPTWAKKVAGMRKIANHSRRSRNSSPDRPDTLILTMAAHSQQLDCAQKTTTENVKLRAALKIVAAAALDRKGGDTQTILDDNNNDLSSS